MLYLPRFVKNSGNDCIPWILETVLHVSASYELEERLKKSQSYLVKIFRLFLHSAPLFFPNGGSAYVEVDKKGEKMDPDWLSKFFSGLEGVK